MKTSIACSSLLLLLALAGCTNREPLFSKASMDPASLPEVLCYDPSPAFLSAPPETSIALFFSVPMKTGTVLEAITVEENGTSIDIYSGTVQWQAGNRLLLWQPPAVFTDGGTISVAIEASAESESSLHLVEPVSWSFQVSTEADPGGAPAPTVTSPGLDDVVLLDEQIIMKFDRKVLRSTVEASFVLRSLDMQDIRTARDGDVTWEYISTNDVRAVFTPHENLRYRKTYEVVVNNNGALCRDLWNNEYTGDFSHTFHSIHNVIYVSSNLGVDINEGYHPTLPVNTISLGIQKAAEYGFSLVRIEGQGAPPDYTETVIVPGGITLEGGWNETFTDHDPWSYPTDIAAQAGEQYAVMVKSSSTVKLRHLSCTGGTVSGTENGALLIDGSSAVTVHSSSFIGSTSSAASHAYGISVVNSSSDITIRDNEYITGGSGDNNTGILVDSGSYNVFIQGNTDIFGGSGGTCYGIQVRDNAGAVVIKDNTEINGGLTNNTTYGVYISLASHVYMYRNSIIGGESTSGDLINNTGIHASNSDEFIVYNNFIIGSGGGTDTGSYCYGIRSNGTEAVIINNTIHGGGTAGGGSADSFALCFSDEDPWDIKPVIANNIIMGGNNSLNYGIRLQTTSPPVDCGIFNNAFHADYCTSYLTVGSINYTTANDVDYNNNDVTPSPESTADFTGSNIQFVDRLAHNYRIDTSSPDPDSIQDNGSPFTTPSFLVAELEEAGGVTADLLTDIDRYLRDQYSIDRGAHEAYP